MMRCFLFLVLGVVGTVQAQVHSAGLNYNNLDAWLGPDKLFYSSFNAGEQWKDWKNTRSTFEPLNLVDQLNLCYEFGGGWNHYFGDCVIDDEDLLVQYLEAVEDAERFGFHFSAPAQRKPIEVDLSALDPQTLDWDDYANWSPQQQLYFSTESAGVPE